MPLPSARGRGGARSPAGPGCCGQEVQETGFSLLGPTLLCEPGSQARPSACFGEQGPVCRAWPLGEAGDLPYEAREIRLRTPAARRRVTKGIALSGVYFLCLCVSTGATVRVEVTRLVSTSHHMGPGG